MRGRYANLRRIQDLDPDVDFADIYRQMVLVEFPFDMKLGLNQGFNRSFSTPSIARILAGTGELTERTRKRRDDTGLLMYEMVIHGLDHPRSREAIRRINRIHRPYRDQPADEYLYVLACCVVIPLRWLDRYAWREPCCHERQATFRFYAELGRLMHVPVPDTLDELTGWFDAYDAEHLVPNPEAAAIERANAGMLGGFARLIVGATYDDRLRAATSAATPPRLVRVAVDRGLRARSLLIRHLGTPRTAGRFEGGLTAPSYPDGYEISDLGPAGSGEGRHDMLDEPDR
ncbi:MULTISPECIES: oxygenase MpaB family protein [Actinoplanes]|uniref:oxygenase MpaB family protein n=1 Tax=Actinoplanes TaxID=1865 RepID=UPI0005F2CD72|nr:MULTISPECIES: oxygenase MpaB family protein [Actinoplanes]GLY07894.1 hypothetical protein Acsp01_82730 [Actinoplanes sp. NBRC 101535]